ncbi:MAG: hypothetical protein DHS20C18_45320 [Saprospiraceae bacterium]|nr:MAG: hypothetical protein DHS20C18_45320 [Saprospiraceae bacterium]
MKRSKLLILLESFSAKELREAHSFVQSPFFNRRKDLISLYEYLRDYLFIYRLIPDKEQIFQKLYPNTPYDDHRLRMCMSLLYKLLEKYLVCREVMEDELKVKTRLVSIFRKRQLDKHFEVAIKDAQSCLRKSPFRDVSFYESSYTLQLEAFQQVASRKRISDFNLQNLANDLDINYIATKLKQVCVLISHQTVFKKEYNFGLLTPLLQYIEQERLTEKPVIAIYYHCYCALTGADHAKHFKIFRELVTHHRDQFPKEEMRDLFLLAINFCLRDYNAGNRAYLKALFQLYQEGLDREYLLTNGIISRFTFRNIVTLGLIQKEYDWVESFLGDYQDKLDNPYRESMYSFCLARLEYSRKNYGKALQLLQKSEYEDLLLNLSAKTVVLKIYFATQEFDALDAHLGAMNTFIRRKKVMGYHRENYKQLIRLTKKMLELPPFDQDGKKSLRKAIEETKSVAEREWLLEQLN